MYFVRKRPDTNRHIVFNRNGKSSTEESQITIFIGCLQNTRQVQRQNFTIVPIGLGMIKLSKQRKGISSRNSINNQRKNRVFSGRGRQGITRNTVAHWFSGRKERWQTNGI